MLSEFYSLMIDVVNHGCSLNFCVIVDAISVIRSLSFRQETEGTVPQLLLIQFGIKAYDFLEFVPREDFNDGRD